MIGKLSGVGSFATGSFATSVIIVSLAINAKYFQKVGVICDQRVLIMCLLPQLISKCLRYVTDEVENAKILLNHMNGVFLLAEFLQADPRKLTCFFLQADVKGYDLLFLLLFGES